MDGDDGVLLVLFRAHEELQLPLLEVPVELGQALGHFLHGLGVFLLVGQLQEHLQVLQAAGLVLVALQGTHQGAPFPLDLGRGLGLLPETGRLHHLVDLGKTDFFLVQLKENLEGP